MQKAFTFSFIWLCFFISVKAQTIQPKGKSVLQSFAPGSTQLLDSKWKAQVEETKNYYLAIPNDDLLKEFRQRAGLPTYGAVDLGGWFTMDLWSPFGQIISGLSRMYAVTGDIKCKQKADALINGWAACIDSTGYFFATKKNNSQHYTYEKMMCALVDAYVYTGNKDALKYLSVITDWAVKNLSHDKKWAGEWYTLPENLYKAYLITGDKKYYNFANEWEYTEFWGPVRDKDDVFKTTKAFHAYSHLNTFSSASMAYLVKGDDKYRQTIISAYDFFQNQECFPTGGFGANEMLTPQDDIIRAVYGTDRSFETQCGSWAVFKLCKYLLTITGDARYGDWIEKMIMNGIGASIPMSADGRVMYYSDYNPREGFKKNIEDPWSCCTGTRIQAMSEYAQLIYFKAADGVYVNLFMPSAVQWDNVKLIQTTQFPSSGQTAFKININGDISHKFTLHFRKPSWLASPATFLLNGKKVNAQIANNWYAITRNWKQGDELVMSLPMDFSFKSLTASKPYPKMLMYGPVAMAIRSANDDYPVELLKSNEPWKNFTVVPGEANTWHMDSGNNFLVRPFYDFKEKEPYVILLDTAVKNRVGSHNITIAGDWHLFYRFSNDTNASVTAKFRGRGFKFIGTRNNDAGKFSVMLDGKDMGEVDQYGKVRGEPFTYELNGLRDGDHTVTIKVLGKKNKDSKGDIINYSTIEKID
jgi:DUF1680 family protein